MQFYTKGEDGEFSEVTQEQLDSEFKPRFERFKNTESTKIRSEVEESVKNELTPKLTEDLTKEIEAKFQPKLDEAQTEIKKLGTQVRQKTIAAEYGFSSDLESFLGDGDDKDMRAKADILKKNHSVAPKAPEKETSQKSNKGFVTKVE